ncbi:MAG: hypothetical protein KH354_06635 [Clostridiales bacterium]|nr:hypothetical protein [Clostridiales bacterium]
MRKTIIRICAVLLLCSILCSCKPDENKGIMTCLKSGNSVMVNITLSECAGKEVSLLALSNPQYQYTWSENMETCLSDISQIALDKDGKGTLEIKLKSSSETAYIILTAEVGNYIAEVK